ncbi:hypothetical protein [Nocardioides sp. KR10-350]|uniref:hypothetical protein n=1 Tax=Nocardioides cheoyonin TaxID=3156615 RepID=UPI0032B376D8
MSVYIIPEHQAAKFDCDFIGGRPGHRSACRASTWAQPDQDALWLDPSTVELPRGWVRSGGGHLCADHAGRVPKDGHVSALTFAGSAS